MPNEELLEVTPESPPVTPGREDPADPKLDTADEAEVARAVITGVEHRGEKVVPLKSLKAERQAKAALRKENDTLKGQVAEANRVAEHYRQYEPYVPRLAELVRQEAEGKTQPQAQQTQVDAATAAIAKELETTPEVAAKLLSVIQKVAGGVVGQAMEPVVGRVATMQSQEMRQRAYLVPDPTNAARPYASKQAIDIVFNGLASTPEGAKLVAQPEVANMLMMIARGIDPQRHEPNLSEMPGGGGDKSGLTAMDRKAAELRGISVDRMRELRGNDSLELE